jgi:hypothetical protein
MKIKNASVRSEKVVIIVSKDGTSKQKLVIGTNLAPNAPEMEVLIAECENFLRTRHDFYDVEIGCTESIA